MSAEHVRKSIIEIASRDINRISVDSDADHDQDVRYWRPIETQTQCKTCQSRRALHSVDYWPVMACNTISLGRTCQSLVAEEFLHGICTAACGVTSWATSAHLHTTLWGRDTMSQDRRATRRVIASKRTDPCFLPLTHNCLVRYLFSTVNPVAPTTLFLTSSLQCSVSLTAASEGYFIK